MDACWIRGHSGYLRLHEFTPDAPIASSRYLPGGKFVVLIYDFGSIELKEVQISDAGEWNFVDVARYEQRNPQEYAGHVSEILTETSYGCPVLAYTNGANDK